MSMRSDEIVAVGVDSMYHNYVDDEAEHSVANDRNVIDPGWIVPFLDGVAVVVVSEYDYNSHYCDSLLLLLLLLSYPVPAGVPSHLVTDSLDDDCSLCQV